MAEPEDLLAFVGSIVEKIDANDLEQPNAITFRFSGGYRLTLFVAEDNGTRNHYIGRRIS